MAANYHPPHKWDAQPAATTSASSPARELPTYDHRVPTVPAPPSPVPVPPVPPPTGLMPPPFPAEDLSPPRVPSWRGGFRFEPIEVGAPGAGASVRHRLDPEFLHRPDTVLDGITLYSSPDPRRAASRPVAELRAASVRGLSHRHAGTVRQDEYGYAQTSDGRYLVAVVADGVSEGRQSHRAAALAAQRGCAYLTGMLDEHTPATLPWDEVVKGLTRELLVLGSRLLRLGDDLSEDDAVRITKTMSTTALLAIVDFAADDMLGVPVHLLSIGDTSAWVLRGSTRWESPQPVKNDGAEISTSAVHALPSLQAREHRPLLTHVAPGEVLLLMSDGVGDALLDGNNDFGDYLAAACATPPSPLEFAARVDFLRKSFDDDRTLVGIWPEARQ